MSRMPDESVRAALEEVLSWPAVARSPQLARFLTYIVEAKLRGDEAGIKAYSIAVDVLGRPTDFDPQSDPIVRVQARRLRSLLDQFYDEGRARSGVRIHLPVGRYVPEFIPLEAQARAVGPTAAAVEPARQAQESLSTPGPPPAHDQPRTAATRSRFLVQAVLGAGIVLAVAAGWLAMQPEPTTPEAAGAGLPEQPRVVVGEFVNVSGMQVLDAVSTSLPVALERVLAPFEDIELSPVTSDTAEVPEAGVYVLSGAINPLPTGYEVAARLTGEEGETLWSGRYARPLSDAGTAAPGLALAVAREVAPYRGPLHAVGRDWLEDQPRPLQAVSGYTCLLTYRLARETGRSNDIADSLACHERLLKAEPDLPLAISSTAWLNMRALISRALPDPTIPQALEGPLAESERALAMRPDSSLIHEHLGGIRNWQNMFDDAAREYVRALELNPLNTDARALYAITLSRAGEWALAGEQAMLAIADTPYPSPWYFFPRALNAYRAGQLGDAIAAARRSAGFAGGEVGSVLALAAASEAGDAALVAELVPRVMGMENLRRVGIIPWLRGQTPDDEILDRVARALQQAGVPPEALTASF
jgi:tetratricopeptide (TPR) repeat protein